jgi:hypothetical protein
VATVIGKNDARKIKKIVDGQSPDRQLLHERLKELRRIVEPPADDMEPPRTEFEGLLAECREKIAADSGNAALKAQSSQLDKVEAAGKDAYDTCERVASSFLSFWSDHGALMAVIDLAALEGDQRFRDIRTSMLNAVNEAIAAVVEDQRERVGSRRSRHHRHLGGAAMLAQTSGHQWDHALRHDRRGAHARHGPPVVLGHDRSQPPS